MSNVLAVEKRLLSNTPTPTLAYKVETRDGVRTFKVPERREVRATSELEVLERATTCPRCGAQMNSGACPDCGYQMDGLIFRGHAAVFDRLSEDLGGFKEKMAHGAFRRTLDRNPDVRALVNHDPTLLLARTTNNTLDLREDPKGLHYYFTAAPTSYAQDLRTLVKRGDINQSSFAFTVERERWEEMEDGSLQVTVLETRDLFDVSPVTYPAYPQTDVTAHDLRPDQETPGELGSSVAPAEEDEHEARKALHRQLVEGAKRRLTLAQVK